MATIKNVALIGANGNLGTVLLDSLVSADCFNVTVIKRESSSSSSSSSSPSSSSYTTKIIPSASDDDGPSPVQFPLCGLTDALRGQDAVVVSFPLRDVEAHLRICQAAYDSGTVRRVIPSDFGSCDARDARARELVPLFARKTRVREKLERLVAEAEEKKKKRGRGGREQGGEGGEEFSWTSIVCGHFFDWGLKGGFLHAYLDSRNADLLDGGRVRSSLSTLGRVGEATVAVLKKKTDDEKVRNRVLFVQSFCVSQVQVVEALERATGGAKWTVKHHDGETFIREHKVKADAGDVEAIEDLVFALGAVDGNWEGREGFAMEMLGLEEEDLDEVVTRVVRQAETK